MKTKNDGIKSIQEFAVNLRETVERLCPGCHVSVETIHKLGGIEKTAFAIRPEGGSIAVTVYLERYWEA